MKRADPRGTLFGLMRAAVRFAVTKETETGEDLDVEDERLRDAAFTFARSLHPADRKRLAGLRERR